MPNDYVVDAHTLIWFLEGNPRLGTNARAILQDPANIFFLPVIALAEACWVVARGKTAIPTVTDLLADVDNDPRIVVLALDRAILDISLQLTAVTEMHDRLIVAIAIHLGSIRNGSLSVLTIDGNITASSLVPVVW